MEQVIDDAAEITVAQLHQSMQQTHSAISQAIYMAQQMAAQKQMLKANQIGNPQLNHQREELRIKLAQLQQNLKPILEDTPQTQPMVSAQSITPMTESETQAIKEVNEAFKHDVSTYITPKKPVKTTTSAPSSPKSKQPTLGR